MPAAEATPLKLDALDAADLEVLSALVQDAVARVADCRYLPREKRFVIEMSRFAWEEEAARPSRWRPFARRRSYRRRRAILDFGRVERAARHGVPEAPDAVLDLLALRFVPGDAAPAGTILLVLAGGATIKLDVECVEARLTDGDAVWETQLRPDHERPQA